MARRNGSDGSSPLESAAGAAGSSVVDAFKVLGNETRLAILLALWEAYDPLAADNALSFTELRERVGVGQGRQFNYHLDKVVGDFVRKTDAGYELRRSGLLLVQSIIAGTGFDDATVERTEIDADCPLCGAPTAVIYEDVYVYQVCTACEGAVDPGGDKPQGTLLGWTLEPTGVADRSAEELFTVSTVKTFSRIVQRFEGICPECSGPVEWTMDVCEDHDPTGDGDCQACGRPDPVLAREVCTVCKSAGYGTPGIKVLFHPAVVSFFHDRGVDLGFTGSTRFADVRRALDLGRSFEETVVSRDPLRVRVDVEYEGEGLSLVLDADMQVVDVAGPTD